MKICALDCQMSYRKAVVRYWPRDHAIMIKLKRFESLACLLSKEEVKPDEYIPYVFGVWEGKYPPRPETLASPISFRHYRRMQVL